MAAELPTKQQLEQLSKEKGHEALVWYAWRNALRALPLLGQRPLTEIWPKDTLKHCIAICRISIILSQYNNISKLNNINATDVAYAATATATATATDADADAYAYAVAYVTADAADSAADDVTAYATSDYNFLKKLNTPLKDYWFSQNLWFSNTKWYKKN